jgi:hypothetical protein
MSSSSRPTASVPELDAPPSVGSSMPPELAYDMARAGELLDLGDTVGARRIVRRVLDRAAPELLGELADLATDLGLAEEDLSPVAGRRADVVWRRPPGGSAVRVRALPAPGLAQLAGPRSTWPTDTRAGRPVRRGRDGGYEAASYAVTRGGVDDDPERDEPAPGYTIDYDRAAVDGLHAAVCLGCRLERTPADVGRGDGVCADCRADGLGRDPLELRCEAILAAAVRRGPWARRQLRALWNGADAAGRARVAAWVAAHDAEIPSAPRGR